MPTSTVSQQIQYSPRRPKLKVEKVKQNYCLKQIFHDNTTRIIISSSDKKKVEAKKALFQESRAFGVEIPNFMFNG